MCGEWLREAKQWEEFRIIIVEFPSMLLWLTTKDALSGCGRQEGNSHHGYYG